MVKSLGILFFLYSLVVGTILFFVPIWDNNMGLYAQIPYEMYMSGNYVIPHLNGVPYIEKPPMLYWFISMSYHAFGVNEFSARLPIFIFMFATIIFIYYMVKQKINEDLAFRASLIFLSSPLLMILNTTILFDIPLMFFVMVSLYYGFEALEKKNKKYLVISYISLAFSVLTKGLVGLALPSIVIFIWAMLKPHRMCTLKFILSPIPVVLFL